MLEYSNASKLGEGGNRRKCGIITLIKSNINAYMSSSSANGPEQPTITVKRQQLYHNGRL